ncbi:MAG TPA: ribosome-binding factor A [Geobacteraceae bacterium]|nr:ribosome-binding factor A [Geobacteraceae bacterium]
MFKRSEKVAEAIHEEISTLLIKGVKDPRIGLVTVTGVKVTDDLHLATVYFSVIGGEAERKGAEAGLNSAKGFLRREIGKVLRMRYVPDLMFRFDESVEYGSRIESLLKQIHETDDLDAEKD